MSVVPPVARRLPVAVGAGAAVAPFSVAATAHGTIGLLVGAAAMVGALLIGTDGPWLLALLLLGQQQRWAWRRTRTVKDTVLLGEPVRRAVEEMLRARGRNLGGGPP